MTTRDLYNRCYRVRFNDLVFDSTVDGETLQCVFEVQKTLYSMANTGSVTLYNLNESHRTELARLRQSRRRIRVEIWAGYGTDPPLLFVGDLRQFEDMGEGTETTTKVSGVDGGYKITDQRWSRTYPAGVDVRVPVRDLVRALSLGDGNLNEVGALQLGNYTTLPRPKSFHGLASASLTAFLRGLGYTWSIQNGAVQILRNGATLQRTGVRLSPGTGLIEAHYLDRRTVRIVAFLIPEVAPGYRITVDSQRVSGDFRVHSVKYSGDSFGGDWICEIECRIPRPITPY